MNTFTYSVVKNNTRFGWDGTTPPYEIIVPDCIIPTNCIKKARAFIKKWALNNGFIYLHYNFVKEGQQYIFIRTNF